MSRTAILVEQLAATHDLPDQDLLFLLTHRDPETSELLRAAAQKAQNG